MKNVIFALSTIITLFASATDLQSQYIHFQQVRRTHNDAVRAMGYTLNPNNIGASMVPRGNSRRKLQITGSTKLTLTTRKRKPARTNR